jgi:hypothetical protein
MSEMSIGFGVFSLGLMGSIAYLLVKHYERKDRWTMMQLTQESTDKMIAEQNKLLEELNSRNANLAILLSKVTGKSAVEIQREIDKGVH